MNKELINKAIEHHTKARDDVKKSSDSQEDKLTVYKHHDKVLKSLEEECQKQ